MLRTALATFMIAGMAAWGQAQNDTSGGAVKVDRATAYYHYALARMYAEMAAASRGRKSDYENEALENYKAAVKADPQTPKLLQGPPPPLPAYRIGPSRTLPKADPSRQRQ
jgi:hypothetical protein